MTLRTYGGGCHCGAVRFEADLDLSAGTVKCNCSICSKLRLWSARVPAEAFRLLAGEAALTDYVGRNPVAHHLFCRTCGVHPFEWVDVPNMTGAKYYNINVGCLDGLDVDELMAAPVTYADGRNDAWEKARPAERAPPLTRACPRRGFAANRAGCDSSSWATWWAGPAGRPWPSTCRGSAATGRSTSWWSTARTPPAAWA